MLCSLSWTLSGHKHSQKHSTCDWDVSLSEYLKYWHGIKGIYQTLEEIFFSQSHSPFSFIYYLLTYLFIYFWLRWVFVAACGLSLVAASGGSSWLQCAGFSLQWLLLLRSTGSRCTGFSSCGSQALERRLSSCGAGA